MKEEFIMILTKSKFLIGLECPRCFWKAMNEKDSNPKTSQQEQNIKNGINVGNLSKKLFSNSRDLTNMELEQNLEATKRYLLLDNVIFEAGLRVNNLYARIDILKPCSDGTWDIIEVKSTSEVKDEHIYDVAFQKYVCEIAGIAINKCSILHLNKDYIKQGQLDLKQLFKTEDVSERVEKVYKKIPEIIEELMCIANLPNEPEVKAEKYFLKEYPCDFNSECWSLLPKNNVSKLYKLSKKRVVKFMKSGINKISEVPDNLLNHNQRIQKAAILNNRPYINKEGIQKFIDTLKYPIYYFDFETFMEPIPRFDNCKAYMQIPFQYSIHIEQQDGEIKHQEFLHKSICDPRREVLESLIKALGDKGSIVVFNQTFEKTRLEELALLYPDYKVAIDNILGRIVDLLNPFSNFYYYSPKQEGSCSIKKVLPAITGRDYSDLDINNGEDASTLYFKATFEDKISIDEKEKVYSDLLNYCKRDTEGMIWIIKELRRLVI